MYIIMVYSLRVKKQAQFILKIATVQEILQKNKREIALVNQTGVYTPKLRFTPSLRIFFRSLAAENPDMQYDMQYAFGAFLLEARRALETASLYRKEKGYRITSLRQPLTLYFFREPCCNNYGLIPCDQNQFDHK